MTERILVNLPGEAKSYTILVGSNLSPTIAKELPKIGKPCIITDTNTMKLFKDSFIKELESSGAETIVFPAGEESKTREMKEKIEDEMMEKGFGRDSVIAALGGGVVGDLAGFVAATYNRGIPFVQIPTTLLAIIDSSIGGKTGVNTRFGKNMIGAFWQPSAIYADTNFLKTLPDREISNGMAEAIKHGLIKDEKYVSYLEKNMGKVIERNDEALKDLISKSMKIKTEFVMKDERETGKRKSANYGHTIGHAIEKLSDYKMRHGEAIAIGMAIEATIALKLGMITRKDVERQNSLLRKASLELKVPKQMKTEEIVNLTHKDKKAREGKAEYVLLKGIGEIAEGTFRVEDKIVAEAIEENR